MPCQGLPVEPALANLDAVTGQHRHAAAVTRDQGGIAVDVDDLDVGLAAATSRFEILEKFIAERAAAPAVEGQQAWPRSA